MTTTNKKIRTTDLYIIETLTNLHAGKGDSNYGIVDKEVQRDSVSTLPTIHASGIKGAMRELLAYHAGNKNVERGNEDATIIDIFGSSPKDQQNFSVGSHNFYQAQLLAMPARSNGVPYFLATSPSVLGDFCKWVERLQIDVNDDLLKELKALESANEPIVYASEDVSIVLEKGEPLFVDEYEEKEGTRKVLSDTLKQFFGHDCICVLNDKKFKDLCSRLPVIARNHLDSGISKNLWYEEVVPSRSLFYWAVERPVEDKNLQEKLKDTNMKVQIGGNASVGYGLCQLRDATK